MIRCRSSGAISDLFRGSECTLNAKVSRVASRENPAHIPTRVRNPDTGGSAPDEIAGSGATRARRRAGPPAGWELEASTSGASPSEASGLEASGRKSGRLAPAWVRCAAASLRTFRRNPATGAARESFLRATSLAVGGRAASCCQVLITPRSRRRRRRATTAAGHSYRSIG